MNINNNDLIIVMLIDNNKYNKKMKCFVIRHIHQQTISTKIIQGDSIFLNQMNVTACAVTYCQKLRLRTKKT